MTSDQRDPEHPCHNSNAYKCTKKRPPCNEDIARLSVRLDPVAQEMRDEARKYMDSVPRNETIQISVNIKVEIGSLEDSHSVDFSQPTRSKQPIVEDMEGRRYKKDMECKQGNDEVPIA